MHQFPYWRFSGYYFAYFAFIGVFMPYFGLYLQSLSFSAWEISLLMSQMQLMRLIGPYLWGVLADRFGQRVRIIRVSSVLSLLVFSTFFLASSFQALLLAMSLLTLFWVAALPLLETLTFDHLGENAANYSRVRLWGSIGFIIAVSVAGALLDRWGLNNLLWMIAFTLAATALGGLAITEAPVHRMTADQISVLQVVRQTHVIALLFACFFMYAAHGVLNVFYSIFLADHGYSKSMVGGLWSLAVISEIAVFFHMSKIMQRFSLRRSLIICFTVAMLRFMMIGWGVMAPAVLVVAQLLHGLTFGAFHAISIAAVNRYFPGRTRARGQAIYSSLTFGAGGLLGGLSSGWTWGHLGPSLTFVLSSAYALVGLALVMRWICEDVPPATTNGSRSATVSA